jgi:ankyrin repeat protein
VTSSEADYKWSREQREKIPAEQLHRRERDGLTILYILLSHKADLDADDGYGATALYEAVYLKKAEMAKVLLRFGAKVNTKTRVYIDGSGDITPLHRATWSVELTKLLLEKGADPDAKDTRGKTPRDWARMFGDEDVDRLYESR